MKPFDKAAIISRASRLGLEKPRMPNLKVPAWASDPATYASVSGPKMDVSKKDNAQYTGTLIIGVATMHKSNAVPVIDDQQAKDISRMRRG